MHIQVNNYVIIISMDVFYINLLFAIEIKNYILKWILVPVLAYLRRYELN
jgi:hypothetical protein